MKITERTRYEDFAGVEKYLKGSAAGALAESAQRAFGGYEHLTLAQFFRCCDGDFSDILNKPEKRGFWSRLFKRRKVAGDWTESPTVMQVYWAKGFGDWAKGFAEILKKLQVPQTPEEQQAQNGLPKMTMQENMLVFARSYFGLHSFDDAEKVTMAEFLMAKHDTYCGAMFQKKLHDIQLKKARAKK